MAKIIRPVILSAFFVWLMPLSAWASSPPAGSVDSNKYVITGGVCDLSNSQNTADLTYNQRTNEWACGELDDLHEGSMETVTVNITLEDRPRPTQDQCEEAGGTYAFEACWYVGAWDQSCESVCNEQGGYYDDCTAEVAGSDRDGGTLSACKEIGKKAWYIVETIERTGNYGRHIGCAIWNQSLYRHSKGPTTSDARLWWKSRICACLLD